MFSLLHAEIVAEAHRKELEHDAHIHRLLMATKNNRPGLFGTILFGMGRQLSNARKGFQSSSVRTPGPVCKQLNTTTKVNPA